MIYSGNLIAAGVIILILFIYFIILIYNSEVIGYFTTDLRCQPGYCATDITTGFKKCPRLSTESVLYDSSKEVCNSPGKCDNKNGPQYALHSDGSSTLVSCESNSECRCINEEICSRYTLSSLNPNPNITSDTITKNLTLTGRNLCSVPVTSIPRCKSKTNITRKELSNCMGYDNNCTEGFIGSICSRGILAIISDDSERFSNENFSDFALNHRVACVAGNPCPCGKITVYDTNSNKIICK